VFALTGGGGSAQRLTFATSGTPPRFFASSCASKAGCDTVGRLPFNPQSGSCIPNARFRDNPSSSDRICSADLLSALFVARLLLSPLVAHDALIGTMAGPRFRSCRSWLRLWHALLAAMFAALILHTFQIVFSGHRDQTLLLSRTA
jgi:hypothetical protein